MCPFSVSDSSGPQPAVTVILAQSLSRVQLLAPAFDEERLFSVAAAWERVSPASGRFPQRG